VLHEVHYETVSSSLCEVTKEITVDPKSPQNIVQMCTDRHTEFTITCCACPDIYLGNTGQEYAGQVFR